MHGVTFEETQRFRQWWLWLLLVAVVTQVFYDLVLKGNALSGHLVVVSMVTIVVVLIVFIRLDTRISLEGIFVKLFPFHRSFKHYPWGMIAKAEVRKYSPLLEFGGWGYRFGFGRKALNISGNMGLQLHFSNGKKLLIGTQRPDEVRSVLQQLGRT